MAVAKKMGAQYMECSSKEMTGVDEIFDRAINTVVANDKRNLEAAMAAAPTTSMGGSGGHSAPGGGRESGGIPGIRPFKKKRKCIYL